MPTVWLAWTYPLVTSRELCKRRYSKWIRQQSRESNALGKSARNIQFVANRILFCLLVCLLACLLHGKLCTVNMRTTVLYLSTLYALSGSLPRFNPLHGLIQKVSVCKPTRKTTALLAFWSFATHPRVSKDYYNLGIQVWLAQSNPKARTWTTWYWVTVFSTPRGLGF